MVQFTIKLTVCERVKFDDNTKLKITIKANNTTIACHKKYKKTGYEKRF